VNTKTLKASSVFYFSVGQPPRCIAGNPLASTRPQKFTTSAYIRSIRLGLKNGLRKT